MMLNGYHPFSLLNQLQRDMGRASPWFHTAQNNNGKAVRRDWSPRVDIKESDKGFLLYVDLPGVKADDVAIDMENEVLTISGQRQSFAAENDSGYQRVERPSGKFYRRFTLPESVDEQQITAKLTDGVLEVSIPKQAKAQPRKITVEAQ